MKEIEGPILPKICDWMLNKNYESQFPSFCHRVKAITREKVEHCHSLGVTNKKAPLNYQKPPLSRYQCFGCSTKLPFSYRFIYIYIIDSSFTSVSAVTSTYHASIYVECTVADTNMVNPHFWIPGVMLMLIIYAF